MPRVTVKALDARLAAVEDRLAALEAKAARPVSTAPPGRAAPPADPDAVKDAVLAAMRRLLALSQDGARTAGAIAAEAGVPRFACYLALRADGPLAAAGLVRIVPGRGADPRYWLTRAGADG